MSANSLEKPNSHPWVTPSMQPSFITFPIRWVLKNTFFFLRPANPIPIGGQLVPIWSQALPAKEKCKSALNTRAISCIEACLPRGIGPGEEGWHYTVLSQLLLIPRSLNDQERRWATSHQAPPTNQLPPPPPHPSPNGLANKLVFTCHSIPSKGQKQVTVQGTRHWNTTSKPKQQAKD